jgi:UDP-N-acetylmuramate--alanine ligase
MQKIHFIGIGGVGMSALAQAFLDKGWQVSGSDRLLALGEETPILRALRAQGCLLYPQDGSAITKAMTVVYSTAIEPTNPDWIAAQQLQCPLLHRSEALAKLAEGHRLIAVTGTCGKSSVTAMLGHLLAVCGKDPFIVNGAEMTGYDANGSRVGSVRSSTTPDGLMVVEADESDKSLMALSPTHVIVTNASNDHFSKEEALALFAAFKAKATGIVLDTCQGSSPCLLSSEGWETRFQWDGATWTLPMRGLHNVSNAMVALAMAKALGCETEALQTALATFKGIRRRLERVGTCNGAIVIDDYAHNTEKLAAAWETLTEAFPEGVIGLWRPHGYAPLRKLKADLPAMFNRVVRACDRLLLLPVYDAGGTADRSVNTEDLLPHLTCPVDLLPDLDAAEAVMRAAATKGKCLALFGARDPGLPKLAQQLTQ